MRVPLELWLFTTVLIVNKYHRRISSVGSLSILYDCYHCNNCNNVTNDSSETDSSDSNNNECSSSKNDNDVAVRTLLTQNNVYN